MKDLFNWLIDNWETGIGIATILYEIIVSLKPSEKNLSIIDMVFKILRIVLPNMRKVKPGVEVVDFTKNGKPLNEVKVRTDHHIVKTLMILFLLSFALSFGGGQGEAYAQTNVTGKLVSSVNADSVLSKNVAQNLFNTYGAQSGSLYYNYQAAKWRITEDSAGVLVWRDLLSSSGGGGGGTLTGANSGLHLSTDGTKVRLGGIIANDTIITGAGLTFSNTTLTTNPTTWNVQKAPTITAGQKFVFVPSATTSGMNFGSLAGNPSVPTDADVWYNSGTGVLSTRIIATTYGINHMISGDFGVTRVPFNHSNANGRLTSDADFTFNTTGNVLSIGDLNMGNASLAGGTRTISLVGSATDIGFSIVSKGTVANLFTSPAGEYRFNIGTAGIEGLRFIGGSTTEMSFGNVNSKISGADNAGGTAFNLTIETGDGLTTADGNIIIETFNGNGSLKLNDGANEQMGSATLVGGTVTVNNTKITADTRIFLTTQSVGGAAGFLVVSARVAATSFTILSSSGTDTSTVAWLLVEPN